MSRTWILTIIAAATAGTEKANAVTLTTYKGFHGKTISVKESYKAQATNVSIGTYYIIILTLHNKNFIFMYYKVPFRARWNVQFTAQITTAADVLALKSGKRSNISRLKYIVRHIFVTAGM